MKITKEKKIGDKTYVLEIESTFTYYYLNIYLLEELVKCIYFKELKDLKKAEESLIFEFDKTFIEEVKSVGYIVKDN